MKAAAILAIIDISRSAAELAARLFATARQDRELTTEEERVIDERLAGLNGPLKPDHWKTDEELKPKG